MLHRQFAKVRSFDDELLENLVQAVKYNRSKQVEQLLEGCSHEQRLQYVKLTVKTKAGLEVNLLHLAVINKQYDMVKIVVSACLDANLLTIRTIDLDDEEDDQRSWTPLQLAEKQKCWEIREYLQHHTENLASDRSIYEYARKLDAYILSAKTQKLDQLETQKFDQDAYILSAKTQQFDQLEKSLRQHKMDILSPDHKIPEVLERWFTQFPSPAPHKNYFAEKKSLWTSSGAKFKSRNADSNVDKYQAIMLNIDKTVCQFQSKQRSLMSMLSMSNRAG